MRDPIPGLTRRMRRLDRNRGAFARLIERYRELHAEVEQGVESGELDKDLATGLAGLLEHLELQATVKTNPKPE
ncbi:MAG: hypothetical protein IT469_11790 [Pseudomonadales bacterium]|nr:hypothetical protein [Pseudomonadales bacterium]